MCIECAPSGPCYKQSNHHPAAVTGSKFAFTRRRVRSAASNAKGVCITSRSGKLKSPPRAYGAPQGVPCTKRPIVLH